MSVHTETAPAVTPTASRAGSPERSRSGAPEAAPRRARSRELEGYRGIAALAIVAFHVCQYALAGTTNPVFSLLTRFEVVDVLFAMSAFLLTLSYARSAIDGDDPQSAGTFLFRRAVRILPLYWVGVVTVWAVRNPTLHADWLDLFEHLTFTQIFDQQRIFYTLGPTWSMSLEIFFYALLVVLGPAAVRLCRRLPSRRQRVRVLLGGCGALFAIPVIWNAVAFLGFHVSYDHWPVYFGPQSRFGAFAVGMALAVFAASRRSEPLFRGVWPSVLRVLALGIVLGATALNRAGTYGQVAYHDIAALGWLLLLASTVLGERGQTWSRWLSWRPLTLAGLISYSTYMWHEPVMMLLGHVGLTSRSAAALPWSILTVLVVSVLVGAVSYRVIEYPTGKLRALRGRDGRSRNYYPELTSTGNG